MADLEKIRIALELYRQDLGSTYPANADYVGGLTPKYIQVIPVGPKSESYEYEQTGSGYTYILTTTLEETGIGYSVTNP